MLSACAVPAGRAARVARALVLALPFAFLAVHAAVAGPGHGDGEGHSHDAPASAVSGSPRVVATSEAYQLVGVLKNGTLTLYLDREADNAPVTTARLTVEADGKTLEAPLRADGCYEIQTTDLTAPGEHELLFTIKEGDKTDLLAGVLATPAPAGSAVPRMGQAASFAAGAWLQAGGAAIAFVLGAVLGALRRRGRAAAVAALCMATALAPRDNARAGPGHGDGEDHSHGPEETASGRGDSPRLLRDGSVFLPKPTQRLLEIRSRYIEAEEARRTIRFPGRIIADPNRSAVVQSTIDGRARPVNGRFPHIGQTVRAGEILAFIEPAFAAIDQTNVTQTAGDLDQQIAVAAVRIEQTRRLARDGIYAPERLKAAEVELANLHARRAALGTSQAKSEPLLAPIDGVISASQTAIGQVATPKDVLFRIVEPHHFWVEALVFDHVEPEDLKSVRGVVSNGGSLELRLIGSGHTHDQQHGALLQFEVTGHKETLDVGHRVTVLADKGDPLHAVVLPRDAVVRAASGLPVVFQHSEPERFTPRIVRVEPLDGERVVILAGAGPGDKIVVQGAALINQVR